jgi:hypothetical protein
MRSSLGGAQRRFCRVLSEQGCQIALRTYRAWSQAGQVVASRIVTDAMVIDTVRDLAWTVDADGPLFGVRRLTPDGHYGRRKMTRLVWLRVPAASPGSVDRAMKALGLNGIRRSKGVRTTIPGKDGRRAGDLLNRDFSAAALNRAWVGFVYVSFVVDVFAQKVVAWNCATSKDMELVMVPLRMATGQRRREGHPAQRG